MKDFELVKKLFIKRTFNCLKTVKRAFTEWKGPVHSKPGESCIDLERFRDLMKCWGFANQTEKLFEWMDHD